MSTYSNLKIEEITLGDSGWGTSTTSNLLAIQQALQSTTLATGNFTTNVATLPWTNTSATTNTPRAMVLNITATLSGAGTVNLPAITGGKPYLVVNNSVGGYAVTVKVTGLTGVSVPNGKAMWLWNNGTDIVDGVNYISSLSLGTALPFASGGTGQTTANAALNAMLPSQTSANGKYLKSDGTNTSWDIIGQATSVANALTIGTGLSGTSYNGSAAVTVAIDSTVATLTGAQTLTNKRNNPRVSSTTSTSSITPDVSSYDQYCVTAQAVGLTINAPTGTPVDGNKLIFRILDSGVSQTLTWNGTYTAIGVTLPTTTVASKTTYVGCVYNAANTRWDVIAVTTQA